MSMLTPPGMGGKYRITGNRYPHMRRPRNRRRIALAVAGAVAALGLVGWGTLQLINVFTGGNGANGGNSTAQAAQGKSDDCAKSGDRPRARPAAALPKPGAITVNVLNATPRGGLAKSTADELKSRGFKVGKVGNAPAEYDKKVKSSGLLLGAPAAADGSLKVLGTQLAGAQVKSDARKGADVDLIIGSEFKSLTAKKDADQGLTALSEPQPTPSSAKKC
ncbi:LytR C-terminal domain-containing protein [Streptomyces sp. NPDC050610]|uniref:LytR C-terminal domain-containing protein n=1 Tax=Streptomyces sp. NPDC050610 TaxID=3157097 RepID=UPI00343CAB38